MPTFRSAHRLALTTTLVVAASVLGACAGNTDHTASLAKPISTSHGVSAAVPSATPNVDLSEFSIGENTTTLHTGTTTFTITNKGRIQHELLVFHTDLTPASFPLDPDGSVQEDGAGLVKVSDGDNLDPGKDQTRTVDFTQPGTYYLVCNLPGHFKAGMVTKVTVS